MEHDMTRIFRLFAALSLISFGIACGGAVNEDDALGDESAADMKADPSEPVTWVAMAQKAAERYSHNGSLMNVEGSAGPTDGFSWTFSFQGDGSIWTTVQCDGHTARVLSHEKRVFIMGVSTVNLKLVKVTYAKLMKIAAKNGLQGRLLHVELAQALAPKAHPHWDLTQGGQEIFVDADTGALLK
jgi:hypothetical protein